MIQTNKVNSIIVEWFLIGQYILSPDYLPYDLILSIANLIMELGNLNNID
jgi:hypothetical protein